MKAKRIISAILAATVLAAGTITTAFMTSAEDTVVQTWDIMTEASSDMVNRSEYNYIEGTITSQHGLDNHFVWGANLSQELPAGDYYINFDYKVTGNEAVRYGDETMPAGAMFHWEIADVAEAKVWALDSDGVRGEWVQASIPFSVYSTVPAGKETRMRPEWVGGDFQITIAKTVFISTEPRSVEEPEESSAAEVSQPITSTPGTSPVKPLQTWDIMTQASVDMAGRSEFDFIAGTITTNKGLNDHFVWGAQLEKDLVPGTYYLNFDYKVSGMGTQIGVEDETKIGFWEFGNGAAAVRFDPPSGNDEWVYASTEFTVSSTVPAGTEIRFKNLWNGGDFQITLAKTVSLTTQPRDYEPVTSEPTVSTPVESKPATSTPVESKPATSTPVASEPTASTPATSSDPIPAEIVQSWDIMVDASPDMINRSVYNYIEGTITTNPGLDNHFVWGANLSKALPAGNYYINFDYKVTGNEASRITDEVPEGGMFHWEIADVVDSKVWALESDGEKGEWVQASIPFTVGSTIPAGTETRMRPEWVGGNFQITIAKNIFITAEPRNDGEPTESTPVVSTPTESTPTGSTPVVEADKTALNALIEKVESALDNAVFGDKEGNYPLSAEKAIASAVSIAGSVSANTNSTQSEVDGAVANLQKAFDAFEKTKIARITKNEETSTEITNLPEDVVIDMKQITDEAVINEIKEVLEALTAGIDGAKYEFKFALDITIMDGDEVLEITTEDGGFYQVAIPLEVIKSKYGVDLDGEKNYNIICRHDGGEEVLDAVIKDGKLYFTTTHFSEFIVAEAVAVAPPTSTETSSTPAGTETSSKAAATSETASKSSSPKTGDNNFVPVMAVVLLLAGASVAIVLRKNANKA